MEKDPTPTSADLVYCSICEKEQPLSTCDYCGAKGAIGCTHHWECKYGGALSYADNLPWFSHAKPGYYCFNCSMPPH